MAGNLKEKWESIPDTTKATALGGAAGVAGVGGLGTAATAYRRGAGARMRDKLLQEEGVQLAYQRAAIQGGGRAEKEIAERGLTATGTEAAQLRQKYVREALEESGFYAKAERAAGRASIAQTPWESRTARKLWPKAGRFTETLGGSALGFGALGLLGGAALGYYLSKNKKRAKSNATKLNQQQLRQRKLLIMKRRRRQAMRRAKVAQSAQAPR